jgi:predicted ester cyclase
MNNHWPLGARAPAGRLISVTVVDIMRLENGKIVEHWGVAGGLAALRQIEDPRAALL